MKKVLAFILAAVVVMGLCFNSFAETYYNIVDVEISSESMTINVGDSVELSSIIHKSGSSFTDEWVGAGKQDTILDGYTGNYVSRAVFTADKPGVYEVTYDICMNSGKSDTYFKGSAVCVINVVGQVSVTGADIRELNFIPVTNTDGSIAGYYAVGNTYILWSDGTSTLYGTTMFFLTSGEMVKEVNVAFEVEGQAYSFTVPLQISGL